MYQLDGAKQLNREKNALAYQKNVDRHFKEKKEMEKLIDYNNNEKNKKREEVYKEGQVRVMANDALAETSFSKTNKAMRMYQKGVECSPVAKLKHKKGDQSHYNPTLMGTVDDYYVHECGHKKLPTNEGRI